MKKVNLPIDAFRDEILTCIEKNPVSIIVAETGAGKSTRVPQFLLENTDYQIVVTQPRRVAAKAVAKRVAEEMNCLFGGLVGFRTAVDRKDSNETRCLFATDGLQLVRELTHAGQSMGRGICLVIDEVHEWNLNIETLVAWAKRNILSGADIKVVLMSATLDFERLSEFFDDAPVVQVPGRCFPVVGSPTHADGIHQVSAGSMLDEIKRLVAEGANQLVFLPGKGEIKQVEHALRQANLSAIILPLHGDVEPSEQELAFKSFTQPKVVLATNIAQTSLTIPDIDAVVDSGLERRIVLVNNVETLLLGNISRADVRQRAGRAGRVKEGQYVLCNDTPYDSFADFPIPEIQRSLLDQMVLRLAGAGLDALELPFYHQPEKQTLVEAKELLYAIEALDHEGNITKLGKKINRFPINVMSARMMLEALDRKCLAPILTITAILGTRYGSIRRKKRDNDPDGWMSWEELLDPKKEYKSDLLVEYDLFKIARAMTDKKWLISHGIDTKGFETAFEIREQIKTAIYNLGYREKDHSRNKTNEDEILKCIASGMLVHLYKHSGGDDYENGGTRQLDRTSIIKKLSNRPKWIVGEPMNITITNRRGRPQTIALVKACTAVDPMWFVEIAPHLVEQKVDNLRFDSETQGIIEDHIVIFNGTEISREKKQSEYSSTVLEKFAYVLANGSFPNDCAWRKIKDANEADFRRYRELRQKSGGEIPEIDSSFFVNHYKEVLEKALVGQNIQYLTMYVVEVILGGFGPLWLPLNFYLPQEEEEKILFKIQQNEFEQEISNLLSVPQEEPFMKNSWGWSMTETGRSLQGQLEEFKNSIVDRLMRNNAEGLKKLAQAEAEILKNNLRAKYEKANALITGAEENFQKILAEVEQDFVRTETSQVREGIQKAKETLQKAEFASVPEHCEVVSKIILSLAGLASERIQKKSEAENSWEEIQNDLYDVFYGRNDFWMTSEDERGGAQSAINLINSLMNDMRYDEALDLIFQVKDLINKVRPNENQRELFNKIRSLEQKLDNIENERNRSGRVEVVWKSVQGPKGIQLQAEGYFSGTVDNRKGENGYSEYEDKKSIFICRENCSWLEVQPKAGERWICTTGFQVSIKDNKPLIVLNPQLRSDGQKAIEDELEILRKQYDDEIEIVEEQSKSLDDVDENNPMYEALRKAGLTK